jgi:RimJ/RimL family protein N-acetyltransferase
VSGAGAPEFTLVSLGPEHLDAVAAVVLDAEVRRWTLFPEPPDPGFPARWIARYAEGRVEGTREGFAAIGADGAFLGTGLAPVIDQQAREMELGYLVAPAARRRGVGAEILRRTARWALDEGALRLVLRISAENVASQRVAERAGFVREGVLRSTYFKNGARDDTVIYARLPSDPEPTFEV